MIRYFVLFVLSSVIVRCSGRPSGILDIISGAHKQIHSTAHGVANSVLGGFNLNFGGHVGVDSQAQAGHHHGAPPHQEGPPETILVVQERPDYGPGPNHGYEPQNDNHHHHHHHHHDGPQFPSQHGHHHNHNGQHFPNQHGNYHNSNNNPHNFDRPPHNNYGNDQTTYGYPQNNNGMGHHHNHHGRPTQYNHGRPDDTTDGVPNQIPQNQNNNEQPWNHNNQNNHGPPPQNNNGSPRPPPQNNNGPPRPPPLNHGPSTQNNFSPSENPTGVQEQSTPDLDAIFNIPPGNKDDQKHHNDIFKNQTTKKPDGPLFIPLNPNEYTYGGDKINASAPKRETDDPKPATSDDGDDEESIDIRLKDE